MKTIHILFTTAILSLGVASCKNDMKSEQSSVAAIETAEVTETSTEAIATTKSEFTIEGMTCAMGCAKRIENKLAEMEGVTSAKVDFDKKLAMVEFESGKVTSEALIETVKNTGEAYSVTEMKTVASFTSNEAEESTTHVCTEKCHKDGCTAEMKAACKKDCKMPCCAKKA
ncbi:MAG: heavy-metal-associated domain-containing protein [Flavobacteriaceae bacterium]